MKFSIRDLLLVTVIVAILVAWWLDRSRQAQVIEGQNVELHSMRLIEEEARAMAEAELAQARAIEARVKAALNSMPTSQAPAPITPKE